MLEGSVGGLGCGGRSWRKSAAGLVPAFDLVNIGVELTPGERTEYDGLTHDIENQWKVVMDAWGQELKGLSGGSLFGKLRELMGDPKGTGVPEIKRYLCLLYKRAAIAERLGLTKADLAAALAKRPLPPPRPSVSTEGGEVRVKAASLAGAIAAIPPDAWGRYAEGVEIVLRPEGGYARRPPGTLWRVPGGSHRYPWRTGPPGGRDPDPIHRSRRSGPQWRTAEGRWSGRTVRGGPRSRMAGPHMDEPALPGILLARQPRG